MAEQMALVPEQPDRDLSMYGFDPSRALLSALLDAINQNTAATIAAAGADPPEFQPAPRPVTEVDRAKQRLRHESRRGLAALALGKSIDDIN